MFLWFNYKILALFLNLKHSASKRTSTKKCYFHIFYADQMFLIVTCDYLLENFLIQAVLQLLTWEFPYWNCLIAAFLNISSLRLPHDCSLENFLIEAALWLFTWEFLHWGLIGTAYLRSFFLKLVATYLRISSLGLPHDRILENFLIEAALQLLTWEFPHWGCLAAAYLIISSLRLSCDCFPGGFLIGAALGLLTLEVSYWSWWLLTWEFPHLGCLTTAYLRISSSRLPSGCLLENFLIEAALGLAAWEFPHWGYLFIKTSLLRIRARPIHLETILTNTDFVKWIT